jgi:hypothetical protein
MLASQSAQAHGEEVVFFFGGQLLALVAVGVIAWRSSRGWVQRSAVVVIPVLLVLPLWFVPRSVFPEFFRFDVFGNLLMGLIPPIALAALTAFVFRALSRGAN